MQNIDVLIIGAGAAGLMCAIEAGKRQRNVAVIDHANKPGKKILMSGGGRCNFTNYHINPDDYISHNPHFCKSALTRYTQWNFLDLVRKHKISFHEKTLGQLFCDNKSKDILDMLLLECEQANAKIKINTQVKSIEKMPDNYFRVNTSIGIFQCESLVIASGGLSIPTMGASPFGYKVAEQFNIPVWPTRAGLVPFTLHQQDKDVLSTLAGIGMDSRVSNSRQSFRENILFTHRGLSGPAILQISSYWNPGETVSINILPDMDLFEYLKIMQKEHPKKQLKTVLHEFIPRRMIDIFIAERGEISLASIAHKDLLHIARQLNAWELLPNGTEGYRTAEVTLGGVDCNALSSKTMECIDVPRLYFIGEVVDVTGWLGGFNFQWAWSSGWAAGQVV
ncbi:MAG TPA: NAD(P)/FAD-dependent oxidoreductase [Gammaproteobacteria bacterium]|nr:NAD(P)/FAD-dependent oxidoreductase [Gammaproteobacteria bacterium]